MNHLTSVTAFVMPKVDCPGRAQAPASIRNDPAGHYVRRSNLPLRFTMFL